MDINCETVNSIDLNNADFRDYETHFNQAEICVSKKDFEEACKHYSKAYDIIFAPLDSLIVKQIINRPRKNKPRKSYSKSKIYKVYERYLKLCKRSIQKNPDDWQTYQGIGSVYKKFGDYEKAVEYF
jgi:tetratricopeptide (TPR) repeat protein